jgi:hypothetical protein
MGLGPRFLCCCLPVGSSCNSFHALIVVALLLARKQLEGKAEIQTEEEDMMP